MSDAIKRDVAFATRLPLWKKAVFLAIPWAVMAVALETATRLFFDPPEAARPANDLKMSEPHPDRIWQYKANFSQRFENSEFATDIRTGAWRLRDEDPTDSTDIRILVVGNSFTFGWGVQEDLRYSEVLERLLEDALPGRTVRILNAGHWLYTFDQHLLVIKELVPRFRPHLVIHGVYGSHVLSIDDHSWITDESGNLERVRFASAQKHILVRPDGALQHTNMWIETPPFGSRFLAKGFQKYFRWKQIREAQTGARAILNPKSQELDEAWTKTRQAIQQADVFLSERSIPYIVFHVPQRGEVRPPEWAEDLKNGVEEGIFDLDLVEGRFREIVDGSSALWVPLLSAFREADDSSVYFSRDPHWTAAGHALAARSLLPAVQALMVDPGTGQRH